MFVRICLKQVHANRGSIHISLGERILIDLNLDADHRPVAGMTYFGYWGSLKFGEEGNGVLLNTDGALDLGCGSDNAERYLKTNILGKSLTLGEFVTVWWGFEVDRGEKIYIVEAITELSAIAAAVSPRVATRFHVDSLAALPRFRARVRTSFEIIGYDNTTYCPPVGVVGDVAFFQGKCVFCPDFAIAGTGQLITVSVNSDNLELINDVDDVLGLSTGE